MPKGGLDRQDDTGLPWALLSEAADPARIVVGAFVIGGNPQAQAVVEIVDVCHSIDPLRDYAEDF